ncbi:MAG: fibronectin type III domain-containing protein, partial [Thermoplasmata archaeon]
MGDSTSSEEVRSRGTSEDQHRLLEPSGELLFQFDNWTPAEESQLQSYASEFYPLAKVTFGAPFFNLTISVEKDETIPVVGLYDPSSDTIKMRFLNKRLFAHEALHAFRDEHMIHIGTFEEGMARALDAYITDNLTSQVSSENYVFHESYNVPGVGSRGGYLHRGGVSSLVRYDLAGYAWLKAFIENDAFFSDFNKYYFQNVTMDSSAQSNETLLKSIVESLVPEIEGLPFQLWYLKEFIFDTYPELGWVTLSFWDYPSIEVRYFERTNNSEIPLPFPLEIEVYNHTGALVSTGTVYHGDRHFYILDLAENYTGKLFSDVWRANGVADGPSRSYGMNHSMGLTGLFGVVPYLNSGSVVVRYSGTEHPVDIVNGTFIIPSLEGYSGKLEIELEGQGCRCRKSLTKGPGSYFVVLDPPGCPSLNLRGRSDTSVELSWDPVVSDDFLLYSLSVSNDTGESIVGFYYDAETANATVTGLEPSSRFSFTMRAYSTRATFHETTLNVSTLPPKPVLFVRANSTTTNSTELEWALAGFPEFSRLDLYQSVQSDSSGVVIRSYSNPNVKKIALGQLDQSRTYFFWLEVRDNQGETSVSNQVRVTCLPESVSILGAEDVTESSFSVRWTHP